MSHGSQGITCSHIDNENVYNKASFDGTLIKWTHVVESWVFSTLLLFKQYLAL